MTREQLDAIRARVEAATRGPWEAGTAFCCPVAGWVDGPKRTVCPVYEGTKRTHTLDANDAEFIAAAREDVPALLAEVERLTAERDELIRWREGWLAVDEASESVAIAAAFQRGVTAMREAAVNAVSFHSYADEIIRALPDPEDRTSTEGKP